MTTHISKIGRLPNLIRNKLGTRLEDGVPGTEIVQWLNAQEEVQEVLNEYFKGRPITEQNLSEWRQTGHLDWLRRQEARQAVADLIDRSQDISEAVPDYQKLSHAFANIFAAQLARLATDLVESETDPEKKWQRLCEIHRELSRLRRDDDHATRTKIRQHRWDCDSQRMFDEDERRETQERKQRLMSMITERVNVKLDAELFGGGERGKMLAEQLYRLKCDMPMEFPPSRKDSQKPAPDTACPSNTQPPSVSPAAGHACAKTPENRPESKLIQPNPVKNGVTNLNGGPRPSSPAAPPV